MMGERDGRGRGRAAVLRAGRRDRHRQAAGSVTIRVPATPPGRRQQETREFGTTRRQLLEMADWLRCWQVERAGMEATSDYWKPVYFLLEREGLDCLLYQACRSRRCPGGRRPTGWTPPGWPGSPGRAPGGQLRAPEDIRRLRTRTRYRRRLTRPARGEGALREAAGGRAPEAVVGDQRHPRRVRPRHAARHHRRRAQPGSPRAEGADPDAAEDRPAAGGLDCSFFTPTTPSSCR